MRWRSSRSGWAFRMAKLAKWERISFTVEGHGIFPVDMLRYDNCHPVDGLSCDRITLTRDNATAEEYMAPRRIEMVRYVLAGSSKESQAPTEGRWASFGWVVLRGSISGWSAA